MPTDIIGEMIYIPKDIRERWSKYGKESMFAFLRDGPEFIENFAVFKEEALTFLQKRPLLEKVLTNDEESEN